MVVDRILDVIRKLRAEGVLRTGATRPQPIQAHARRDRGQPPAEVVDAGRIDPVESEPRLLHGILRIGAGAEHPIGHRPQPRPVCLELRRDPIDLIHRHVLGLMNPIDTTDPVSQM